MKKNKKSKSVEKALSKLKVKLEPMAAGLSKSTKSKFFHMLPATQSHELQAMLQTIQNTIALFEKTINEQGQNLPDVAVNVDSMTSDANKKILWFDRFERLCEAGFA